MTDTGKIEVAGNKALTPTMSEQIQKLQPSDLLRDDFFGVSVAISGELAIAGAIKTDAPDQPNAGAAYIFKVR